MSKGKGKEKEQETEASFIYDDGDAKDYILPLPQGYVPHGPPQVGGPRNMPIAIGKKPGPHISGEELTAIIARMAHGDNDYSVRARVLTTHGNVKELFGGNNYTIGDEREVHLVLLSGSFKFQRRGRVSYVDNMQLEIDAVDGNVITFGHTSTFQEYYSDPSLLDALRIDPR